VEALKKQPEITQQQIDAFFDDFLCHKSDDVDNAAFNLIRQGDPSFEWDIEKIGNVIDDLVWEYYNQKKIFCYPFYVEDCPCYRFEDELKSCYGSCSDSCEFIKWLKNYLHIASLSEVIKCQ
jgi:hypothetical protein